ncbi:hypothetical protein B0H21DRAFT_827163 [Amylocystis lapponica]|nr:hypothetical protein B0H21DRAFT_827163 [Amylocystis lapponica]
MVEDSEPERIQPKPRKEKEKKAVLIGSNGLKKRHNMKSRVLWHKFGHCDRQHTHAPPDRRKGLRRRDVAFFHPPKAKPADRRINQAGLHPVCPRTTVSPGQNRRRMEGLTACMISAVCTRAGSSHSAAGAARVGTWNVDSTASANTHARSHSSGAIPSSVDDPEA